MYCINITSITRQDEKLFNQQYLTANGDTRGKYKTVVSQNIKDQGAFSNAVMFNLFYIQ